MESKDFVQSHLDKHFPLNEEVIEESEKEIEQLKSYSEEDVTVDLSHHEGKEESMISPHSSSALLTLRARAIS